ncbi:hypothetical protein M7I_2092 [Glarea lozoyensis 74030]|uniref:Uncharacterized protein n=1 Tax=Glarea lozoyensis (strain ATCC 74030 / MF5533) TaxID=1104152 RepID=H0EHV3_GLAL7|nr:hypothetical protein M7I_2092 [Glarea lozoyensis 74030]
MKAHDVIHFDNDEPQQVSRIPYTGHPENRYVISRAAAPNSPGVYQNTDGHYVVRYDEDGTVGILTVQPNKWYHFQQIAFRLGRYISQLLTWSAEYKAVYLDHAQTQYDQHKECDDLITLAIGDENSQSGCAEISAPNIRHLAYDLHAVAPDLAEEAGLVFQSKDYDDTAEGQAIVREAEETGLPPRAPVEMTTRQAAKLLNMQVTQELNNNWESRFPENERIWDFAAHRIAAQPQKSDDGNTVFAKPAVQKFFSMRRFPEKSKAATQEDIEAQYESGMSRREERPGEIYRGGKMEPMFPFGETPYQENFLSWQMEQALKDGIITLIPRFQSPRPSRWTMPTFTLPRFKLVTLSPKPPPNPFDLPALPKSFDPVSQTEEEKRFEDIEARREEARKDRAQNPNKEQLDLENLLKGIA